MIPKIIHYCWLSGDEFPDSIRRCLDSWQEHLSGYDFWLWDMNRFDINATKWTEQAFKTRKYAFAADYIRLYALYHHGGIYLDSDVYVYKSFDDLLHLPYFIGEDYVHCFEPAIIGAEAGCKWVKDVLDHYADREFVMPDGTLDMYALPRVFHDRLAPRYQFRSVQMPLTAFTFTPSVINVFPSDHFNSRDYIGPIQTPHSYCAHNYAGSWLSSSSNGRLKTVLKAVTPRPLANTFYRMTQHFREKSLDRIQIPFTTQSAHLTVGGVRLSRSLQPATRSLVAYKQAA